MNKLENIKMNNRQNMEILEENDLINLYLRKYEAESKPVMVQIGANEGMYEYAKKDGKDFIFEFLMHNAHWEALLIEPIPDIYQVLKKNYDKHTNAISFINCAIADKVEESKLHVAGRDGRRASLIAPRNVIENDVKEIIEVQCLPYEMACKVMGINKVDFVKIDAEGYDEVIVMAILNGKQSELIPKIILWESLRASKIECEKLLLEKGYKVFLTGLNTRDFYMDKVAIHNSIL